MISCSLLVPARVPGFASLLFFSFLFHRKRIAFHRDFLAASGSGLGFRGLSPSYSFPFLFRNGAPNEFFIVHKRRGNMVCCCLGSMLV